MGTITTRRDRKTEEMVVYRQICAFIPYSMWEAARDLNIQKSEVIREALAAKITELRMKNATENTAQTTP